jgi:predicted secreted protein
MAITKAKGTLQQLGDGASPEVFATITQVRSISGPNVTATIQDITTHSTAGNWMESLATLVSGGEVSFAVNLDLADATHAFATGLWNELITLALSNYKTVFPNSVGELAYGAYVSSHGFDAPVDNVLQGNMALATTGTITGT